MRVTLRAMRFAAVLMTFALCGCTFGAPPATVSTGTSSASVTAIDVNLTASTPQSTAAGTSGGYAPAVVSVRVGALLQFVNRDGFAHTASSFGGATYPTSSPLAATALNAAGSRLSTGFSTGTLAAGGSSQTILADVGGTYLYGCFFHYGAPMRAEIDVR